VGLVAGRQALLERESLVLFGANLAGSRVADGGKVVIVKAGLFGELLAKALVLNLPAQRLAAAHQRHDQHQ